MVIAASVPAAPSGIDVPCQFAADGRHCIAEVFRVHLGGFALPSAHITGGDRFQTGIAATTGTVLAALLALLMGFLRPKIRREAAGATVTNVMLAGKRPAA